MQEQVNKLRENYPGFLFHANNKKQIVMRKQCIGGTRMIGVFNSLEELIDHVQNMPGD